MVSISHSFSIHPLPMIPHSHMDPDEQLICQVGPTVPVPWLSLPVSGWKLVINASATTNCTNRRTDAPPTTSIHLSPCVEILIPCPSIHSLSNASSASVGHAGISIDGDLTGIGCSRDAGDLKGKARAEDDRGWRW